MCRESYTAQEPAVCSELTCSADFKTEGDTDTHFRHTHTSLLSFYLVVAICPAESLTQIFDTKVKLFFLTICVFVLKIGK